MPKHYNEFTTISAILNKSMIDKNKTQQDTKQLISGLLREAIGYRIEYEIPHYKGIVGYMVEAPMLWINRSRFPIFVVAYHKENTDILADIVKQMEIAEATEYFALLIVVPTHPNNGNEAEELSQIVANSIYRHDFIVLDYQHLRSIIAQNTSKRLIEIIQAQGVELATLSPYTEVGPVPVSMFFGREAEIKTISQTIQKTNYALIGGRRIGKSSTLQQLERLFNKDNRFTALYFNCEAIFNPQDWLDLFGEAFEQTEQSPPPTFSRQAVKQLKNSLNTHTLIFLMDEIDELLLADAQATPKGKLFKTFRAFAHEGLCHFIFSGGRVLYQQLHNAHSPFFNFARELILPPLDAHSAAEIIQKPMAQLGVILAEEESLINRILDLTACHPSLIQWLCNRLLQTITVRLITLTDLETVISSDSFYRQFIEVTWGMASPLEKLITLLIEEPTIEFDQLLQKLALYNLTNRLQIQAALDILQLYSFLSRSGSQYRLIYTHFPRIVRAAEDIPTLIEALMNEITEAKSTQSLTLEATP